MDKLNKCIFFIEDEDLLEKCNTIWNKLSADVQKEFAGEPVYTKNFLKTKIKSYGDEVTDFYNKEIPKGTIIIHVYQ